MGEAISPQISVVIPAFNEALTIGKVVSNTIDSLKALGRPYEVLVVDDGSFDLTGEVAREEGASVVELRKNTGKGSALKTAFRLARGDIIVTMSADGLDNPEEIGKLIAPLSEEVDLVIGSRFLKANTENYSIGRKLASLFLNTLISFLVGKRIKDARITDIQSGYIAIKNTALKHLDLKSNGFDIETEILLKSIKRGLVIKEIPIVTLPLRFYYTPKFRRKSVSDYLLLLKQLLSVAET